MSDQVHTFAGSPLDRASRQRRDAAWVGQRLHDSESRFLPLRDLQVLVRPHSAPELAWLTRDEAAALAELDSAAVMLGLWDGVPHFALELSDADPLAETEFRELRSVAPELSGQETAIAAQARSLVDWHARHQFCAACGAATRAGLGGGMRACDACGAEHFPRVDPVVIMLVIDGDRCLLGHGRGRAGNTYTCLAGFVEPGETIEEAVRREVLEESSVRVGAVRYHSSQPWPFPSSLMLGCHAEAASVEIDVDPVEIAEARWFPRDQVRDAVAVAGGSAEPSSSLDFAVPPPLTISYHLIRAWASGEL